MGAQRINDIARQSPLTSNDPRKKFSMTVAVISTIKCTSSEVTLYAGASKIWSPLTPSAVPEPGYMLMLKGGCMPAKEVSDYIANEDNTTRRSWG